MVTYASAACFLLAALLCVKALSAGNLSTGNTSWQLSAKLGIASGQVQLGADGTGKVAFRLTPADSVGSWQVDDLYVDPHRR